MMRLASALNVKSYVIIFLVVLAAASLLANQNTALLIQLIIAVVLTAAADVVINLVKIRKLIITSSAIISGLFVGSLLPTLPIHIVTAAALLAMASKHVIKYHGRHIFNPAGFGIVISGAAFGFIPVWWSSTSLLSVPLGIFILYKLRKWYLFLSFLITYYIILMAQNISSVSLLSFVDPTLLFFAFFMLTEPLTSAYNKNAMIAQGIIVAVLVILVSLFVRGADIFLLPLLISNIFVETLNKRLKNFALFRKSDQRISQ